MALPGRFPSPTPSTQSTGIRSRSNPSATAPNASSPYEHAYYGELMQRPQLPNTRSESTLPLDRTIPQRLPNPRTPDGSRPRQKQRSTSDPRHDRRRNILDQTYASASRVTRPRRRAVHRASPLPATILEDTIARTDPPPPFWSPQFVSEELRSKVRSQNKNQHNDVGVVYILRDQSRPHLLKIGSTKNLGNRIRNLESRCNIQIDIVYTSPDLKNYARAESLAHIDVRHLNRPYTCPGCATYHTEWHELDNDVARKIVDRWVAFLQQEPYDEQGRLKSLWDHLLSRRRKGTVDEAFQNHDARWIYWEGLVAPLSFLDQLDYVTTSIQCHPLWSYAWQYSWQVSCVLAWLLLFLAVWNKYVLYCFLFHVGCSYKSVSNGLSRKRRART